jgi:hypothetical protein
MKAQSISVGSATTSAWIPVDTSKTPFNIGFGAVVSALGVLTYKVQHTFDDIQNSTVTPTAFDHPDATGKTVNTDGNYAYPVRAVRLNVTAYTSGTATLTLIQAG